MKLLFMRSRQLWQVIRQQHTSTLLRVFLKAWLKLSKYTLPDWVTQQKCVQSRAATSISQAFRQVASYHQWFASDYWTRIKLFQTLWLYSQATTRNTGIFLPRICHQQVHKKHMCLVCVLVCLDPKRWSMVKWSKIQQINCRDLKSKIKC
jgi:hypothetical protein